MLSMDAQEHLYQTSLIIYLSAIERLICRREMSLIGPILPSVCTNYDT